MVDVEFLHSFGSVNLVTTRLVLASFEALTGSVMNVHDSTLNLETFYAADLLVLVAPT